MMYRRTTLLLLSVTLAVVVASAIALHWVNSDEQDPWASLPATIQKHEAGLLQVAELARKGGEYRQAYESVRETWPELLGPVSVDENGNVYFVVSANVWANAGFVCRQGEEPLLGDGFEPQIRAAKHLYGPWWYYRSS